MVEISTIDDAAIDDAQARLAPVVGDICQRDWLRYGMREGFYQAREIRRDGVAQYRYFFHVNDQNYLNVNASVFVGQGKPDPWLWLMGADIIAREKKCRGIVAMSNRRGHVEQCRRAGFKILGVAMERTFENVAA